MPNDTQGAVAQEEQREQTRLAPGAMLIPLFFVILFAIRVAARFGPHGSAPLNPR